jgi:diguanylate cyclase
MMFVLGLAIVNLSLGYLTARALAEPPLFGGFRLRLPARRRKPAADHAPAAVSSGGASSGPGATPDSYPEHELPALPAVAPVDELPPDWLAKLAAEGIVAQSFVEGVAHAIRLEVGQYREQLVAAECRTRSLTNDGDAEGLARVADDLRTLNQAWLDQQTQAADLLTERSGRLGDHEKAATALEQELLDQAALIRTSCAALESLDETPEVAARSKRMLEQLTALLVHAHALRDRILDLLATMLAATSALETYGPLLQRDVLTRLPNRIGLDALLSAWRRDETSATRLLSAILIDLDRFGRVNQRLGTRSGDNTIVALARLLEETIAKDRGFERLARVGGAAFLIFQGDVGPHQALTAAERLRQSIEATTFDDEGVEFDLTISCGVIEAKHGESSLQLVERAFETLRFAKKAGRNRCALDKGEGPTMLDPPQFPVKARTISLRAALVSGAAQHGEREA